MRLKSLLVLGSLLMITSNILAQSFNIGHTSVVFFDSSRNRNIETEIYYPSDSSGENVPLASGNFPVIVFGHGFLMDWESYQNIWTELVPSGYVICFPTTEMGLNPSHENFGLDLKFLATQMQNENNDSSSLFFNSLAPKTGVMGHSMGGGASFLAAENNPSIHALINFAAAETNPSAIAAAANISVPSLIFSGDDDCIAPPIDHQNMMYNSLNSDCKTHISIINGGHCYFADYNFNCSLGESFCNPTLDISPEEQQLITFNFLKLWLDYTLNNNLNAFITFNDSLQASIQINFSQTCDVLDIQDLNENEKIEIFPNPVIEKLNLVLPNENPSGLLVIYNNIGQKVYQILVDRTNFQINLSNLSKGIYLIVYSNDSYKYSRKFIKVGNN